MYDTYSHVELSLRQTEVLLADMVLKGMVKRHTPEMGVRSAGLFADAKQ